METQELIAKLKSTLNNVEKAFERSVLSVHAMQTKRIFTDGKKADGSEIGQYNATRPVYVEPSGAINFAPKGKPGSNEKKEKKRSSGYFQSYKAYRQSIGRETAYVNLVLTGQLQSDYRRPPVRVSPGEYAVTLTNVADAQKVSGAIHKYGTDIFSLSKDEKLLLTETMAKELSDLK